ncbi:hypothetical protein N7541_007534 [Penicillium brevicompactum]|uniref:NACHT domain-containing protein n=1 Tax=Penicillium brevicompactum TaxID=5074 RepID=A0A9W9QXC1_PENBR|nr:hypothetical protein N7541_007534 [Penicillium brevicompactum]
MEIPSSIENRFGDARASGDGIAFQAGVNNGTININQRPRQIPLPKVVYNATFDAANKEHLPSCLQNTRVELLEEIQAWIDGDNPKKVFWLSGMAGTGKSTIALTLARTYKRAVGAKGHQRNVCLGATFFFSRGGGDLSSASKFPATIAIQLAEASGELRKLIGDVIEDNPRLDSLGVRAQWEKLVIGPLSMLSQSSENQTTFLLIVDALDECNDADDTNSIIRCLEEVTHMEGVGCRVFLTSRPEHAMRLIMNANTSAPRENFVLHKIERSIVNQDLELYYRDQLSRIKAAMSSNEELFSERMIRQLVKRSNGLFIHAATVCKFVRDGKWHAVERLKCLVETEKSDSAELELDKMYTIVLEYSSVSVTEGLNPDEAEKVHQLCQRVIGAIIVVFDTMSSESLAMLLGVKRESIIEALSALHSVIDVPESYSEPIRILHPSFREFLLNPNRCTDIFYSILVSDAHCDLLTRCFAILMSQLKRNMLEISKPGAKVRDISMDRIDAGISMELQYSSMYWWSHFKNSVDHSRKDLLLLEFLEDKYLSWLECLAWLGKLGHAIEAMSNMNAVLVRTSQSKSSTSMPSKHRKSNTTRWLHTFVPDALQFLLGNKLMIERTPLQLYVSALIFSKKSSEVRKRYRKEAPSWILNEPYLPDDSSKRSSGGLPIAHASVIYSVAISSDSSLVATACGDCMVHIWDTLSGMERFVLEGNSDGVASVCFSSNGFLVGSFVGNRVSVWNIQAALGAKHQPECQFRFTRQGLETASSHHPTCAISPSGTLVAVVDYPHDIWVWDMRATQSVKYHFQVESQRHITGVYFSSDGSLLLSITLPSDTAIDPICTETLSAWDTSTGIKISTERSAPEELFLGVMPGTRHIAISPGVSRNEKYLTLRDALTGLDDMIAPLDLGRCPLKALCRPADGKFLLASILINGHVILWMPGGEITIVWESYFSESKSIDFSPNGKYLILATSSNEVRIWNIEDFGHKPTRLVKLHQGFRGIGSSCGKLLRMVLNPSHVKRSSNNFTQWIRSPDGSLLATSGWSCPTITIWNTKTGEKKFCLNVSKGFSCPTFSSSGNVFAVLVKSGIHFWETKTGRKGDILKTNGSLILEDRDLEISEKGGIFVSIGHDTWDTQSVPKFYGWELDGLRKISNFEIPCSDQSFQIALSPNEKLYCLWKRTSATIELGSFPGNTIQRTALRGNTELARFTPDGEHVLILDDVIEGPRQAVHIWNIAQECLKTVYIDLPLNIGNRKGVSPCIGETQNEYRTRVYGQYDDGFVSPDGKLLALVYHPWPRRLPGSYFGHPLVIDLLKISDFTTPFRVEPEVWEMTRFAPSGNHLITERGNVPMPGASPPFSLLFATRSWIQEDGEDILEIPPAYRYSLDGIHGHTITFNNDHNGPLFVRLDEGIKTMTV